jgi:hypothetical protein
MGHRQAVPCRYASPGLHPKPPSAFFAFTAQALNPGHAATLAAAGANVDEAVNHITSGMAQLVGHLTSATPEQLQEVVEELLTGLDQHMAALGSTVKGMQKWKLPRPYVNRRVRQAGQAGAAKAPGPNPSDAGEGEWRDAAIAIDAFCSGTATAVPSAGAQLTKVVLRQKLIEQVKSLGQRALDRVADGQVAADVRSMGQALQQQFKDPRQVSSGFHAMAHHTHLSSFWCACKLHVWQLLQTVPYPRGQGTLHKHCARTVYALTVASSFVVGLFALKHGMALTTCLVLEGSVSRRLCCMMYCQGCSPAHALRVAACRGCTSSTGPWACSGPPWGATPALTS